MKRWLWILFSLALAVGAIAQQASRGQAPPNPGDLGPGAQGSTLRLPGTDVPAAPGPVIPPSLQGAWNQTLEPNPYPGLVRTGTSHVALPPSNSVDINKDITITPGVGPWTIMVMSYTTPRQPDTPGLDAAKMARDFVTEWNGNPIYAKFKLKAHVFNFNAEEKQKEYERVQKLKREQIEALNQLGLNGKTMPIRIQTVRIDEQTTVLLGGFRDADAAMKVAQEIRKLPPPDIKRVKVDCIYSGGFEPEKPGKGPSASGPGNPNTGFAVSQYINPFTKATPVRNPTALINKEQPGMTPAAELDFLRKVNSGEPLSLLNSKKPFTLAVKQFNSQCKTMADAKEAKNFINQFNDLFGRKQGEWVDGAAHNAHNLAEALRKTRLEAYVLHCQCCSYVAVGSYSGPQDPELVQMQRFLETYFQAEGFRFLDMFARPVPMAVPGMPIPQGALPGVAAR